MLHRREQIAGGCHCVGCAPPCFRSLCGLRASLFASPSVLGLFCLINSVIRQKGPANKERRADLLRFECGDSAPILTRVQQSAQTYQTEYGGKVGSELGTFGLAGDDPRHEMLAVRAEYVVGVPDLTVSAA